MKGGSSRALLAIVGVALIHATIFIVYQRPDWYTKWDDQVGYRRLGSAIAATGRFTRYPGVEPFVPETIRTPGYPLVVAAVYLVGGETQVGVAIVQAVMFAAMCLLVYAMTARLATEWVALGAGLMTALFSPIPYYGALVLTDVFATLLVTAGIWTALRAIQDRRRLDVLATGVLFGLATLTRPTWALYPVALVMTIAAAVAFTREWRRVLPWGWMFGAFALVLAPWLLYNVVYVQRLTLSPAGGLGRATWEASWQGQWPGQMQAALTRLANRPTSDAQLDEEVNQFAAENGRPAEPMRAYVHQFRDIRRIWDTPTDPRERAVQRIVADDEYWRVGQENIARDRIGHLMRRLTTGLGVLWIADVPIRYSDIDATPRIFVRLLWLAQAALVGLALVGIVFLVHRGRRIEAAPFVALVAYVTIVHLPLLAESRYSLPAKPTILLLAAIALAEIGHRILPQTGDYLP